MEKSHQYKTNLEWTGNRGSGTSGYRAYDRDHIISIDGKADIHGSSDPAFRGDPNRHNPEELLVASLSSCHMLCYLHLCADHRITVVQYTDIATGVMVEDHQGGGRFSEVNLHPVVHIKEEDQYMLAITLHEKAHKMCFIAGSCNFPVKHHPSCIVNKS